MEKYDASYVRDKLVSAQDANEFATIFYKDAAEIYDCITRIKNIERNPTGFSIDDAPVLGLLVRIWKLLKEVIKYYEQDNAEIMSFLDRPILEAAVVASYLMTKDRGVMEDFRTAPAINARFRSADQGLRFHSPSARRSTVEMVLLQ